MFAIPHGESLATFERYPDAQELVKTLVSKGVPARALSIVGSPVALVERVTGKIGYGRAAVSAAISGSWLGLIVGLVFVVLSPTDFITPLLAGLLIGAGVGMMAGMVLFTFAKGPKRFYRSMQQVIAESYRVVIESSELTGAQAAMSDVKPAKES
jgi:hypothetical protein